jgi:mono/diheme cytochrome c family protein
MIRIVLCSVLLTLTLAVPALAAEPELTVSIDGVEQHHARDALLARSDAVTVEIPDDVAYGRPMRYRAVPLAALLPADLEPSGISLEAVATDGFAAQLPAELVLGLGDKGAAAFLAIEPGDAPWPPLPGKEVSAGPFYVVWVRPEASGVRSEQWPYQLARIAGVEDPIRRWPQLAVDESLAADAPERAGQTLFITQCLACHTLNGAGAASMGPDLNRPMNPTEYMKADALRRLIRDPASVRTWPGQTMPGFTPDMLSDQELDHILAYLEHMAARKADP